jgi:segregation and condensation protein A
MSVETLLADDYKVDLEVFEGPLDLLLYLIRREEVDIYDIPIEKITKQYMEYLDIMRMLDLNIAGEFLVMAATLMMIKSRMLLPVESRSRPSTDRVQEVQGCRRRIAPTRSVEARVLRLWRRGA